MEERESSSKSAREAAVFNKKRAEGRDESDRPKKLQLKVRTLNPANTISYVQVRQMVFLISRVCVGVFIIIIWYFLSLASSSVVLLG